MASRCEPPQRRPMFGDGLRFCRCETNGFSYDPAPGPIEFTGATVGGHEQFTRQGDGNPGVSTGLFGHGSIRQSY